MQGRRGVHWNCREQDVWGIGGIYSSEPQSTRGGSLELNGYNCSNGETSLDMYKLNEAMKMSCRDLLAIHQRSVHMEEWRFFSH
jgi:hypothetical protein